MNAAIRPEHPYRATSSDTASGVALEKSADKNVNPYSIRRPCRTHLISHAANRLDQRRVTIIHLAPQVVDINIHHIGCGIEGQVPDMFNDHCPRQPPPGVAHQILE